MPLRKLTLLAHVIFSIGWIGAVACFLALALTGLDSPDTLVVRAVYMALEPVTTYVIVPSSFAALLTGLLLSLGTRWGLYHYWVLAKLLINVLSIIILLLHSQIIYYVSSAAKEANFSPADLGGTRTKLVVIAIAALAALLIATVLSVYKPRGVTPYGLPKQLNGTKAPL